MNCVNEFIVNTELHHFQRKMRQKSQNLKSYENYPIKGFFLKMDKLTDTLPYTKGYKIFPTCWAYQACKHLTSLIHIVSPNIVGHMYMEREVAYFCLL